jgi:hypothetical protein
MNSFSTTVLARPNTFCAKFGSTDAIHRSVPNGPLCLRPMTAKAAHRVVRDSGVLFDLATFRRPNCYVA